MSEIGPGVLERLRRYDTLTVCNLILDRNGVTSIPREIAAELVDIADEFVAAEEIVLDALREGSSPSLAGLRQARTESKSRIEELRARVSRAST